MNVFPALSLPFDGGLLRPYEAADAPDVAVGCGDEETLRWLPLPVPYTLDVAHKWCTVVAESRRVSGEGLHLAVVPDGHPSTVAGGIGLNHTNWAARVTEIGYWTTPARRGRGLATRATRALALWALDPDGGAMQRVELRAATGNAASRGVARRAGFTEEGTLRNAGYVHGGRVDLVVYSLIPADV